MENSNIYSALANAQANVKPAGKSGENTYDKYTYAMLQDYCEVIRGPMIENGLALSVSVIEVIDLPDRTTSLGKVEHAVRVKLQGILSHKSGETLTYHGWGEGQDRADKAIYKAITGGKKYLLANIFNVPTTDDPETDSHVDSSDDGHKKPSIVKTDKQQHADKPIQQPAVAQQQDMLANTAVSTEQPQLEQQREQTIRGIVREVTSPAPTAKYKLYKVRLDDDTMLGTYEQKVGEDIVKYINCEVEFPFTVTAKGNKVFKEFKLVSGEPLPF